MSHLKRLDAGAAGSDSSDPPWLDHLRFLTTFITTLRSFHFDFLSLFF